MYAIYIVEGKYLPPQLDQRGFNEECGTAILLVYLTKAIFGTVKMIILDGGFCVLKSVISLKKHGVYA